MNAYKTASRLKLTFEHTKGQLQVSQLWDLPLDSRGNVEGLKDIARKLDKEIKDRGSDLFDETNISSTTKLKFDIVMDIIETKIAEAQKKTQDLAKSQEIARIEAILAEKQDNKLNSMDEDQLKARLAELNAK